MRGLLLLALAGVASAAATPATPAAPDADAGVRVVAATDGCHHANPALANATFACPGGLSCLYQDASPCDGVFGNWDKARGPCACVPSGAKVVVIGRGEPCGGAVADGAFPWCALVPPAEASETARGGRGACVHGNLEPCEPGKQSLWGACQCHPRPGSGRLWGDTPTVLPAGGPCTAALTYRDTVCEDPTLCTDTATGKACPRDVFLASGLMMAAGPAVSPPPCECRAREE
jgi:hypothetical protein